MRVFLFLLLSLSFSFISGCDSNNLSPHDASVDIDSDDYDCYYWLEPDADAEDVPDYTDTQDATDYPDEDPYINVVSCNKKQASLYFPWFYYGYLETVIEDNYKVAYENRWRYNIETGVEEQLPTFDNLGYGDNEFVNLDNAKIYNIGRTIRYISNPADDGIFGPFEITEIDVMSGDYHKIHEGVELMSDDCLAADLDMLPSSSRSTVSIWKMSPDENEVLIQCTYMTVHSEQRLDLYRLNFTTGEKTFLFKGSDEDSLRIVRSGGYYLHDVGGDYVSERFEFYNNHTEIRVWNWKTGELLWQSSDYSFSGIESIASEDGWIYFTITEQREDEHYYLRVVGYNFLTGETSEFPMPMQSSYAPIPVLAGHPELIGFMAGDGPIFSSEPRIPSGPRYFFLWNKYTDVVRRVTDISVSYGELSFAYGEDPPHTMLFHFDNCYFSKDLIEAGIMTPDGILLPDATGI